MHSEIHWPETPPDLHSKLLVLCPSCPPHPLSMQRLCAAAGHKTAAQPGAAWRSPLPWAPSTLPPPALTAAGGARAANDRLLRLSSRLRRGGELTAQAANDGEVLSKIEEILKKYDDNGQALSRRQAPAPASTPAPAPAPATAGNGGMGNGLFAILAINGLMYAGANLMHLPALGSLALDHWAPRWWQFVTATFVHANWQHLRWGQAATCCVQAPPGIAAAGSSQQQQQAPSPSPRSTPPPNRCSGNAFALLVFGRMVEEEEGWLGVWLTYLLAGVGGTVASYLTAPHTHTISLGASGAVFGLFMVRCGWGSSSERGGVGGGGGEVRCHCCAAGLQL